MCQHPGQLPHDPKALLRRELRTRRSNLPTHTRAPFDEAIQKHLSQLVKSRNINSIACYWPFNGEPDITPVCKQLLARGCQFALPVISNKNDFGMTFHSWTSDTTLSKNWYGIYEPQQSAEISIADFDMLIMPLVAYDLDGNRLGVGAGYYDRHLELLRDSATPLRVGVAYSLQEVDPIEKNSWDIPLHGLVNELGWFTFV